MSLGPLLAFKLNNMKQSIFKTLLLIASLLVFTQQAAQAQEADKTVTLVVNGQGKTPEEAKQNAFLIKQKGKNNNPNQANPSTSSG
jgi:hypothetical protein